MKDHQDAHARSFEQENRERGHLPGKWGSNCLILTLVECAEDEPPNVRKAEKGGDNGVRASFSPQGVGDFAIVSCPSLPIDSSLCLNEEPSDQKNHDDRLNQETYANHFVHQAI